MMIPLAETQNAGNYKDFVPARDLAAIDAIAVAQKRRIQKKSYKSSAQNTSLYWIQEGVISKNMFGS
jgi:hypothetical protein